MDDRQRYNDPEEVLRLAIDGLLSMAWTGLPGYIVSFDPDSVTATVQLGIKGSTENPDGTKSSTNYPLLTGVPVEFPGGGGCRLTFPVVEGDECWVSFACRAIGGWKQYGGIQPANDPRKHHLSDAVCRIGPMSQANKLSGVSASTVQLRSEDQLTYVELDPVGKAVNVVAPGGVNANGNTMVTGNLGSTSGATGVVTTITGQTLMFKNGLLINIF